PGRGECGNRRLCDFQALVGTVESLPLAFHRSHNASFPRPSFCQKVERTFLVSPETQSVAHRFCYRAGFFSLTEYLSYAEGQLRQSHQWAEQTRVNEAN